MIANNGSGRSPWWRGPYRDGATFTWDLLYRCNYRCSYCWWEQKKLWGEFSKKYPPVPAQKWIDAWRRLGGRYGRARLDVLGGEPLATPDAAGFFAELSKHHDLVINTNLSPGRKELETLAARCVREAVYINASFHPEFAERESFLEKMRLLKEAGFPAAVFVVSYPPLIPQLPKIREFFSKAGIPVGVQVFQGTYRGRDYPAAFTEAEREALKTDAGLRSSEERWAYRVEERPTRGKLCCAGWFYGNVKADGEVYRCGGTGPGLETEARVGNLFQEDFELFPGPAPCPAGRCFCQEHIYLLEEQEKKCPDLVERWASGKRAQ
ncbi:MAG TPA: hypothetical protein P5079_01270 [Elusimicrobiota bacterium]|nr:hypothetical protein [Elusimicrobiota bacterium]